jgi:hypothetical protein
LIGWRAICSIDVNHQSIGSKTNAGLSTPASESHYQNCNKCPTIAPTPPVVNSTAIYGQLPFRISGRRSPFTTVVVRIRNSIAIFLLSRVGVMYFSRIGIPIVYTRAGRLVARKTRVIASIARVLGAITAAVTVWRNH